MTNRKPPCRFCGAPLGHSFLDLGSMPLANSYVKRADLEKPEPGFPLHARLCERCFLVQVEEVVPAEAIFGDYAYFSSYSDTWVAHARAYAEAMRERLALGSNSQVIEVASNDGYLLQHFVASKIPVLGIEPAANVAKVAEARGVPTRTAFFNREAAEALRAEGYAADLIVANNVLAHVPDLIGFVAGFTILLKPEGVLTVEAPHLMNLIEEAQFDTIYHEHFCYFSLAVIERVLAAHGLRVFDVEELPTHGGSLRILACRADCAAYAEGPGLAGVRAREREARLDALETYQGFAPRVEAIRDALVSFLDEAKAAGKTVAAYGAAAKGNTLLNYCGIGTDRVAYVVDRNPVKQGCYLPGSHIPVLAPGKIGETRPDFVLILPWNLRHEIAAVLAEVATWGGQLVTAIPALEVFAPPR